MGIRFPVLQITEKRNSMFVEYDEKQFGKCTSKSLSDGIFERMTLLDSDGNKFIVEEVIDVEPLNAFWSWPMEFLMHSSRLLKVSMGTNLQEKLNLEGVKEFVISKVNSQKDDWSSSVGIKGVIKDIEEANSIEDIIQAIQPQ